MGEITQESHFEMLEKLPDGNFKIKYPKVKSKSGVTFDEHLTSGVTSSFAIGSRNSSLTGEQTINLLPNRTPTKVSVVAYIDNTQIASWGFVTKNGQQSIAQDLAGNITRSFRAIMIAPNASSTAFADVTMVKGGVKLDWFKSGSPTQTILLLFIADYHGED